LGSDPHNYGPTTLTVYKYEFIPAEVNEELDNVELWVGQYQDYGLLTFFHVQTKDGLW